MVREAIPKINYLPFSIVVSAVYQAGAGIAQEGHLNIGPNQLGLLASYSLRVPLSLVARLVGLEFES